MSPAVFSKGGRHMKHTSSHAGFSLVEAAISSALMTVGALGVASLFIYGTRMQSVARYSSTATELAQARLEQLRMLPPGSTGRTAGGTLADNSQANYTAVVGAYRLRWLVAAGPAGTIDITVRAIPLDGQARAAEVRSLVWR